jgi:predicted 2-oxoglutarate/Fe(II)-dependent dioxygenase YbiX
MREHKDNGYENNSVLSPRYISSVTYINDDFEGGETFIKTENGDYYYSVPKTGSVVLFHSDERSMHGVERIDSGYRITLPIWFTKEYSKSELARNNIGSVISV